MRRIVPFVALSFIAGCSSAPGSLQLSVHASQQTPSRLEWATVVGSANGVPFTQEIPGPSLGGQHTGSPATRWNDGAYGVAFGGSKDGRWISQGFASFGANAGDTLEFSLGGDLLTNQLDTTPPLAAASGAVITVDTTRLSFTASPDRTASAEAHIANVGSVISSNLRIATVGPAAGRFGFHGCDGQALPAGTSCTLHVTFDVRPDTTGSQTVGLVVDGGNAGLQTMVLVGHPVGDPTLELSAANDGNFGTVDRQGKSAPQTFTIRNTGGFATSPISVSTEDWDFNSFTVDARGCLGSDGKGVALDPGKSCDVSVVFSPPNAGIFSASLVARADEGGQVKMPLMGKGRVPLTLAVASPTAVGALENGTGAAFTVDIKNIGSVATGPLTFHATNVTLQSPIQDGTPSIVSLSPGGTYRISFYASAQTSPIAGNIHVSSDPGGELDVPITVDVGHFIDLRVDGSPITGNDYVFAANVSSATHNITVQNLSKYTLPIFMSVFGGTTYLTWTSGSCTGTLAPGGFCSASLSADVGSRGAGVSDWAEFYFQTPGFIPLYVSSWYWPLQTSAAHLAVPYNGQATRDLVVTNVGSASISGISIDNGDGEASGFTIVSSTCVPSTVLGPSQSCTVRLTLDITRYSGGQHKLLVKQGGFSVPVSLQPAD